MRDMLGFNICDLQDSHVLNTAILDLPSQVNKTISPRLSYSCWFWMHHLQDVECTPDLLNEVTLFFKAFLPYWLEAISLLSFFSPLLSIQSALDACNILKKWGKVRSTVIVSGEY